jgi:hypothetical protein
MVIMMLILTLKQMLKLILMLMQMLTMTHGDPDAEIYDYNA